MTLRELNFFIPSSQKVAISGFLQTEDAYKGLVADIPESLLDMPVFGLFTIPCEDILQITLSLREVA